MSVAEITDRLGLSKLRSRNWYVQASRATAPDDEGLYEGLEWLSDQLKNFKQSA